MKDEEQEKIIEAIKALPLLPDAKRKIPSIVTRIKIISMLAGVNELPRAQACTKETSRKELDDFIKKAIKLHDCIGGLHRTSLERFEINGINHPLVLRHELEQLIYLAGKLDYEARSIQSSGIKQGRPKFLKARTLTDELAKIYKELTGKEAKRNFSHVSGETGKFLKFSASIFTALGLTNSAKSQVLIRSKSMYAKSKKVRH